MWDDFQEPEPEEPRWRSCLYRLVAILIIVSLLGTALSSYFVLRTRLRQVPTATPDNSIVAAAATPTNLPNTPTPIAPTATPTATKEPTATATADPNRVDRIVFVNSEQQLETIAADGTSSQPITDSSTRFTFPVWSPNGQQIAAIGNGLTFSGLFVFSASTPATLFQPLYRQRAGGPIYLYWSPDSQHVGFITAAPGAEMSFQVVPADGSAESRELGMGQPFYWDWTDDGTQALISSNGQVSLLDLANGRQEAIARPGRFQAPAVSTNGRFWAYAASDTFGRLSNITIEDRETGERIQEEHAGVVALGWRPNANQLAYISPLRSSRRFYGPLRLLDAETGTVETLRTDTVLAFFWSPNGRYLAYITFGGFREGLQEAAVRQHKAKPAQQQRDSLQLTLSVLDIETRQGLQLLQFEPTALFFAQFLPFFDQYAHSHRLWSVDGDAIVLPIRQDDRDQIAVVPISGGLMRTIAQGSIAFWSPQ